jgi:hypothetical protein
MLQLFHILFGRRQEKKRPDLAPIPEVFSAIAPTVPAATPYQGNGGELVAVIAAAISAAAGEATGAAASAFRITSINPSSDNDNGFNTPIWGRIERYAQK